MDARPSSGRHSPDAEAPDPSAGRDLVSSASDELFQLDLELRPFLATFVGVREASALVPDLSDAGMTERRARLVALRDRVEAVGEHGLDLQDRITRSMVLAQASNSIATIDTRPQEYSVSASSSRLPATALMTIIPKTPVVDRADADAYLTRCSGLGTMLDDAATWLGRGASAGRAPVRRLVEGSLEQIDGYLGSDEPERELGRAADPGDSSSDPLWRERLATLVATEIRPALGRYAEELRSRILPASRPDDRAGLCWIPDGDQGYAAAIAEHTTTGMSADEIHALGLEVVETLRGEARRLGESALGTSDLAEIRTRLREDPALYFTTSDEVVAAARRAFEAAEAALPDWIDRLPATRCEVRAQPPLEARHAAFAYYRPGDPVTDVPGVFWINTHDPRSNARFELSAICAHESVPGHHVQWSLAREAAEQSRYRRYAVPTSFIEGWALYCERLAEEMGLYRDDLDRLGLWSLQSWRAARLVVDTGIHAKGWSRQQAIEYLRDNTVTSERNVVGEVDRYIGNPGQALAYMIGALRFADLRQRAQTALGSGFRAGEFHLRLLENGALPLHALSAVVDEWLVGKER